MAGSGYELPNHHNLFKAIIQSVLRKSCETGEHLTRMTALARLLVDSLQANCTDRGADAACHEAIVRFAYLHDIGKLYVPTEVLHKKARLSDEEFAQIKLHVTHGRDLLAKYKTHIPAPLYEVIVSLVYSHHERWDGTGYPQGLRKEEIPLPARLLAICDVYDALATVRSYRQAWSRERCAEHMLAGRGTHFAPALVDAFVAVEPHFWQVVSTPADPDGVWKCSSGQ